MLKIEHIHASYGDLKVLHDVTIEVNQGEIVSLVGSNGAGKTMLLRILSGFVPITKGSVTFNGINLLKEKTSSRAKLGIAHIPQGRGILGKLTVLENLELGAYEKRTQNHFPSNLEKAYALFPILKARTSQKAGSLSGGEQQMLAIARALMMEPQLIMMDEPSLGLAPIVIDELFAKIKKINKELKQTILLVEQNAFIALETASRAYILNTGRITMEGKTSELINNTAIQESYLGLKQIADDPA